MRFHNWLKPIFKKACASSSPTQTTLQSSCQGKLSNQLPPVKTSSAWKPIWIQSRKLTKIAPNSCVHHEEQTGGNITILKQEHYTPAETGHKNSTLPSWKKHIIVLQMCFLLTKQQKQDNAYSVTTLTPWLVTLSSTAWFFLILSLACHLDCKYLFCFHVHKTLGIKVFHSAAIQVY